MRFKLGRYGIEVTPDCDADEAYIEDTLGLKKNGDAVPLIRQGCIGSFAMAHLSTPGPSDRNKWYCETHGAFAARIASNELHEDLPEPCATPKVDE